MATTTDTISRDEAEKLGFYIVGIRPADAQREVYDATNAETGSAPAELTGDEGMSYSILGGLPGRYPATRAGTDDFGSIEEALGGIAGLLYAQEPEYLARIVARYGAERLPFTASLT